jgi:transposase InsO family protein
VLHHSDRGSQYAAYRYQRRLSEHGITPGMSHRGTCWDNACGESFFGTRKRELIHHRQYRTREETIQDIFSAHQTPAIPVHITGSLHDWFEIARFSTYPTYHRNLV